MKYKLLKDLPLAKAGTEVKFWLSQEAYQQEEIQDMYSNVIAFISKKDIPEWLEEVKEAKSIYDLKEGDEYYLLDSLLTIWKYKTTNEWNWYKNAHINNFPTEREAKRNKLLRELATREKWLPNDWEKYIDSRWQVFSFHNASEYILEYHNWFVFRNEEEYNKWMTEENKSLLFVI